jgi:N-acetylglucosaminyldiphosphoundecaprenol N-acetyl-beta-D-mannosaminyltransferase
MEQNHRPVVTARGAQDAPAPTEPPLGGELREIMGLRFWDIDLASAAAFLVDAAAFGRRLQVFFVNAHCVNVAARDLRYRQLLTNSGFLFADGAGMALAARFSGITLKNNVNGTDLFPKLCQAAAAASLPIAFLGARGGVARKCAALMEDKYPGLRIVWVEDGYRSSQEEDVRIPELNASGAKMLLVAKGVPGQEHWIAANAARLTPSVILGVGALFDFYSGTMPRAPQLVRDLRIEWLYRLLHEPRRLFRRYVVGNPEFIARVLLRRLFH